MTAQKATPFEIENHFVTVIQLDISEQVWVKHNKPVFKIESVSSKTTSQGRRKQFNFEKKLQLAKWYEFD